jgi:hypothetical protein
MLVRRIGPHGLLCVEKSNSEGILCRFQSNTWENRVLFQLMDLNVLKLKQKK